MSHRRDFIGGPTDAWPCYQRVRGRQTRQLRRAQGGWREPHHIDALCPFAGLSHPIASLSFRMPGAFGWHQEAQSDYSAYTVRLFVGIKEFLMSADYAHALGARLRSIRAQQGLSLHGVEEKSEGRWKAVVVGSYERGDRAVTVAKLAELAEFYGVPVAELLPDARASGWPSCRHIRPVRWRGTPRRFSHSAVITTARS